MGRIELGVVSNQLRMSSVFAVIVTVCSLTPAVAQQPVCPPPSPSQLYYATCGLRVMMPVRRFLTEFAVDHLFKPASLPFERSPLDLVAPLAGSQFEADGDLSEQLGSLAPLRFTRLDKSTGTVDAAFGEGTRSFSAALEVPEGQHRLSFELPERLAGGYWRTPEVLQVAFWEGKRIAFVLELADGQRREGGISCLSLSSESLRLVTSDPIAPDFLLNFRECR